METMFEHCPSLRQLFFSIYSVYYHISLVSLLSDAVVAAAGCSLVAAALLLIVAAAAVAVPAAAAAVGHQAAPFCCKLH